MSSVLGYLLDPMSSHGFGREALVTFLEPIEKEIKKLISSNVVTSLARPGDGVRMLVNKTQRIVVEFERPCVTENPEAKKEKRILDLVINLYDQDSKIKLVIAIENKIKLTSATDKHQLIEEYTSLRNEVEENIPIIFIYLTPEILINNDDDSLWSYFSDNFSKWSALYQSDLYFSYAWRRKIANNIECNSSKITQATIYNFANELLNKERNAKINPASSYSDLLLRSMLRFVDQNFKCEEFKSEIDPSGTDYSTSFLESDEDFWGKISSRSIAKECFAKNIKQILVAKLKTISDKQDQLHVISYVTKNRYAFFVSNTDLKPTKFSRGRVFTIRSDGRTVQTQDLLLEVYFNCTSAFDFKGVNNDEWILESHKQGVTILFKTPWDSRVSTELNEFLGYLIENSLYQAKNEL